MTDITWARTVSDLNIISHPGHFRLNDNNAIALTMDDDALANWHHIGHPWRNSEQGEMRPAVCKADHHMAFYTAQAFGDFEAEFEFRIEVHWGTSVTFMFRAQDAQHYYILDFPVVGQQYRAEHFWAMIAKVDHRGYRDVLHYQRMPGVSCVPMQWHHARLTMVGDEICAWVNGRPLAVVHDATFSKPGFVGLASTAGDNNNSVAFRNVRIRSEQPAKAPKWNKAIQPRRNWGVVDPELGGGIARIVRLANNELVCINQRSKIFRSADNGHNWSDGEWLTCEKWGYLHPMVDGTVALFSLSDSSPFILSRALSHDNCHTWTKLEKIAQIDLPEDEQMDQLYTSTLLALRDGTLLLFIIGRTKFENIMHRGRRHIKLTDSPPYLNLALRSTDEGRTWSQWVDIDGPPYLDHMHSICKDNRSEIGAAETLDGHIITLTRPNESPWMWESWSYDKGETFTPAARGAFPMYACNNAMVCTTSGYLVIGGRFPGMGLQVSYDSGMTWKCYQVDTHDGGNGGMFEVEPDVVLFVYAEHFHLRYLLIRITPDGIEPVEPKQFDQGRVLKMALVTPWQFKIDPKSIGEKQGWHHPDHPDDNWQMIDTDRQWNYQGVDFEGGSAWYRIQFSMPADFDIRKYLWLHFGAVDEEAFIFIDGQQVFEHSLASTDLSLELPGPGREEDVLYTKPFHFDVRPYIKPGQQQTLAVRVYSHASLGGICHGVGLVSSEDDLAAGWLRYVPTL